MLTITIVLVGWAFFRAGSTRAALALIADLAGRSAASPTPFFAFERSLVIAIAAGGLAVEWLIQHLGVPAEDRSLGSLRLAAVIVLLALALLFRPVVGVRFIYFQF